MMPEPAPTPPSTISPPRLVGRILVAVIIWLAANLITFLVVSFVIFIVLGSMGMAQNEELFTLSVVCAIPAALTVSSLVAGRKLIHLTVQRYRENR